MARLHTSDGMSMKQMVENPVPIRARENLSLSWAGEGYSPQVIPLKIPTQRQPAIMIDRFEDSLLSVVTQYMYVEKRGKICKGRADPKTKES